MRRQKLVIDPDLGDLEEMLAHVQTQLEHEIDLEKESKMPSFSNVQESPKPVKRSSSFNRENLDYRRPLPRPPLNRLRSEIDSGSHSLNGEYLQRNGDKYSEYQIPNNEFNKLRGSQNSLMEDIGSQTSLKSFKSEPGQRLSVLSLPDKRSAYASSGRGRTATLPRGYGSSKEKNWEEYWAQ